MAQNDENTRFQPHDDTSMHESETAEEEAGRAEEEAGQAQANDVAGGELSVREPSDFEIAACAEAKNCTMEEARDWLRMQNFMIQVVLDNFDRLIDDDSEEP